MKELLLLILLGIAVGRRARRLAWRELAVIALAAGLLVGWQTASVVFRYIPVE